MSLIKRLEKEIDHVKYIIGALAALMAGLTAWFVNTDNNVNFYFQIIAIILFSVSLFGIINQHKKVLRLLDKLEKADD